ncbi:hypothetical protein [uncultured Duncaniella sp.]|uniref:hypothetical protein n=1 Tax=uncultured Duncaniella sp. TaxID=2768039 RepID=UPI00321FC38D
MLREDASTSATFHDRSEGQLNSIPTDIEVGICIMGSIFVSRAESYTRRDYENRIEQLNRWYEDNAEAIAFGQFYRENFPKQYRDWQTSHWHNCISYQAPDATPPPPPATPIYPGGIILISMHTLN